MHYNIFLFILFALLLLASCKHSENGSSCFDSSMQCMDSIEILPISKKEPIIVPMQKIGDTVNASELIREVSYVFLETTPESLIGDYTEVMIYKNYIYVLDYIIGKNVYIFNHRGRFIKKMPIGEGPDEFAEIRGMFVDKYHDQLIVFDAGNRRFVHCTLDGIPTGKMTDSQVSFTWYFAITRSGELVYDTEILGNSHIKDLYMYRLLYTDSTGVIKKAAVEYDDNKELHTLYSRINNGGDAILYHPKYVDHIYEITDTAEVVKYVVDMSNFSPANISHIQSLHSLPEFHDYLKSKTMLSDFADTNDYLYFLVKRNERRVYSFYNKRTKQTRSFYHIIFDSDFIVDIPPVFTDGTHFIGTATPEKLKQMAEYRRRDGHPLNKELEEKIANLKEDDNSPLVLFTLK